MRALYLTGFAILGLAGCSSPESAVIDPNEPVVTMTDFEVIEGEGWSGSLTYLDYSSDKRVTIPTTATVNIASARVIKYTLSYPDEPWEDTKAKLKLSKSGRLFDGHTVTSRELRADGDLELRTVHQGEDNNLPAEIRMTYVIGASKFAIEKDVLLEGETDFVNRNIYRFTRP